MRVALIDPSLFTLPYDRALAQGLRQLGHRVSLHGRPVGPDDNDSYGIDLRPDFYRIAMSRALSGLPKKARMVVKGLEHGLCLRRLHKQLQAEKPGVIHFQWLPLPVIDRRFLPRFAAVAPMVLTVHDTNPFNGNPSAALQSKGFFETIGMFDALIVHTEQGRVRLQEQGLPADKIHVAPHGLLLQPDALSVATDAMDGALTLLMFGAIKPYKGLDVLLRGFAALPETLRSQARILVCGKPAMDLAPLHALAAELGVADRLKIEPGFVPDSAVPELFSRDVIALFPYREIEASGVLSIALSRGRPVIASAIGNFRETVQDGVQGLLVPPGDVSALTQALTRMIGDRAFAGACSRAAYAASSATPGWDDIARRTTKIYQAAERQAANRLDRAA